MATIKGVLVDVKNEKVKVVEVEKELESYHKMLDCRCIDITSRMIDGKEFDIVCDDEGLFDNDPKLSAITADYQPALVGNLFIVKFDGYQDITSLSQEDIDFILEHIQKLCTNRHPFGYPMLVGLEY